MTLPFSFTYALRSLRRSGQQTLLALLCVAFGVMSLVALQSLAALITTALLADPRMVVGGDAQIHRQGAPISRAELDALHAAGVFERYTPYTQWNVATMRVRGSGRVTFLSRILAIDPSSYPLVGTLRIADPDGGDLAQLLAAPDTAIVSQDLAWRSNIAVGDQIVLDLEADGAPPQTLTVVGIATMLPDHQGATVLYSLATAARGQATSEPITHASLLWGSAAERSALLAPHGFSITTPADVLARRSDVSDLFGLMLKGAGLMGLLVGGIAVTGTLRVILARRIQEIAVLKTVGFSQRRILEMLALELSLLGAVGGLAGSIAGSALAYPLVILMGRSGTFLLEWQIAPLVFVGGILVGTLTALIFGLDAALRTALVRPATLLRTTTLPAHRQLTLFTFLVVALGYTSIASVIMGSPLIGAAVVFGGSLSLTLLGGLLALVCFGLVRFPLPGPGDLDLARQGLQREIRRAALPLVAIFTGTLCVAISGSAISSASNRVAAQLIDTGGYNLLVQAAPGEADAIRDALVQAGAEAPQSAVRLSAEVHTLAGPVADLRAIEARPAAHADWDLHISTGAWTGAANTVLVPDIYTRPPHHWLVGDELTVVLADGAAYPLQIAGFYYPAAVGPLGGTWATLVVADTTFPAAVDTGVLRVLATAPSAALPTIANIVGSALPTALVVSAADLSEAQARSYLDLFTFVAAVAGLAFVAGAVLIANSVGLAMVQRRRELAVLKAVGFSRGRVLRLIALEHGFLGLLGGASGLAAAWAALQVINRLQPRAEISMDPLVAVSVGLIAIGLAIVSAALSAQRAVRSRPLAVLREI
jgi:putative ABC transport system permease protein